MAYRRVSKARRKSSWKAATEPSAGVAITIISKIPTGRPRRSNKRRQVRSSTKTAKNLFTRKEDTEFTTTQKDSVDSTPSTSTLVEASVGTPSTDTGLHEDQVAAQSITPRKLRSAGPVEVALSAL